MKFEEYISADRIGGLVWTIFGAAVIYGSWTMDRLTSLQIHPATVPGLVPGLLGVGFVALGIILLLRPQGSAVASPTFLPDETAQEAAAEHGGDDFAWRRLLLSWLLCVAYGGLLLGHGLPYWALTTGFLVLHLLLLDETDRVPARPDAQRLILAAILAPVVAVVVSMVFQHIFLVRLP